MSSARKSIDNIYTPLGSEQMVEGLLDKQAIKFRFPTVVVSPSAEVITHTRHMVPDSRSMALPFFSITQDRFHKLPKLPTADEIVDRITSNDSELTLAIKPGIKSEQLSGIYLLANQQPVGRRAKRKPNLLVVPMVITLADTEELQISRNYAWTPFQELKEQTRQMVDCYQQGKREDFETPALLDGILNGRLKTISYIGSATLGSDVARPS